MDHLKSKEQEAAAALTLKSHAQHLFFACGMEAFAGRSAVEAARQLIARGVRDTAARHDPQKTRQSRWRGWGC